MICNVRAQPRAHDDIQETERLEKELRKGEDALAAQGQRIQFLQKQLHRLREDIDRRNGGPWKRLDDRVPLPRGIT